jgi:Protein of unknown function (DUF732)
MFSHRITKIATTVIGTTAMGLTALAAAGTAGATTTDDAFIAQMNTQGIYFTSPQAGVREGQQVCKELSAGKIGTDIAREVLSQTDLTPKQAAYFVINATRTYCPEFSGQLTSKSV